MSGPHALDHTSLPEKLSIPDRLQGINGMKLAFSTDLGHYELANDVEREFLASIQSLSNTGAKLEEVPLDGLSEIIRLSHGAQEFLAHGFLKAAVENHSDVISDYVPELLETALKYDVEDYQRSKLLAGEIWQNQLGPIFQKYDALICPTVSSPMVPAENWQTHKILLNDRQLTDTEMTMTALFNLYSRCPVLAVPSGMTNDGLPCGLQIVGRPCDDITVFRIGAAFEVVRPWMKLDKIQPSWDLIHKNNKWSEIRMGETDEQ
jgi:Asp-tRNA(Asn)/Glu-tRNA(Gln) amidotransferase A subunit family amidase